MTLLHGENNIQDELSKICNTLRGKRVKKKWRVNDSLIDSQFKTLTHSNNGSNALRQSHIRNAVFQKISETIFSTR